MATTGFRGTTIPLELHNCIRSRLEPYTLCVHGFGTGTSSTGLLKFELPKSFAGGLNATVLDIWLF